ncbi:hypothetical protein PIB30_051483 [Stylosanthes scabra]|uniref:Uncharacterized protein n=1 Tax=Stylosanthes scabra TaxID=79078 RepID=A0ABU6YKC9_9FABA|nr:hypothetical protein [Stylosanthes scabra]
MYSEWLQLQTFYDGLSNTSRILLDSSADERSVKRGVMEINTMDALLAQNKAITQQLSTLNKKMEKLEVAAMGTQVETTTTCDLCGDAHENQNYGLLRDETCNDPTSSTS